MGCDTYYEAHKPEVHSKPQKSSKKSWAPGETEDPIHGYVLDGNTSHPVSVKWGEDANIQHTLISDGHVSNDEHGGGHNHYGKKREGPGYFNEDRGKYSGPGH